MEETEKESLKSILARIQKRVAQGKSLAKASEERKPYGQLPLFPEEDTSILPNHLAKTPLFAPIQPGRRKMFDNAVLASPEGFEVRFTGKQLDMADQDVFMLALKYARSTELNCPIRCNRADFLRELGWSAGGRKGGFSAAAYKWLDESFQRLTSGTLHIKTKRYKAHIALVADWAQDSETGAWEFTISGKMRALFQNNEYAFIDLAKRQQISHRVELAKWLQSYSSTHEPGLHRISIVNLKEWCGYNSPIRKFREALVEALRELERLEILTGVCFYRDGKMVQWTRLLTNISYIK